MALVKHNHQMALVILPLKVKAIVKAALASMYVLFERERRGSVVVSTPAYHAADRGSNLARTRRDYLV